jgi:hypothetical protein
MAGQRRAQEVFSSERSQERLDQILTGFLDRDRRAASEADLLPQ